MVERFEHAPEAHAILLGRLTEELGDHRQDHLERADVAQDLERLERVPAAQQSEDLLEQTRWRGARQVGRDLGHRLEGWLLEREAEPAGELGGADDPHRVLAEPHDRLADGAQHTVLDVVETADVVDDLVRRLGRRTAR